MQQSAAGWNWEPTQLLTPHIRFPEQSLSLSQSPSFNPHGFELEQHPHVSAADVPLQLHLGSSEIKCIEEIHTLQTLNAFETNFVANL